MNLHALTFEQILRACASLEDPREIRTMIQALEVLERNIRYRRQELTGMLNGLEIREKREKERHRSTVKSSLRVVRTEEEEE
jgi:hypothetical protein